MEVAGKMQVHLIHRHDLRITAPRSPAFDPKTRAKGSFSDANGGILADRIQAVAQPNSRSCFPLAGRRWINGCNENKLAAGFAGKGVYEIFRDLGLIITKWDQSLYWDAQRASDRLYGGFLGISGDFDI